MRDNDLILMTLRPNAKFKNNMVNCFSLSTIAKTYIGKDLPTEQEMDACWESIKTKKQEPTDQEWLDAIIAKEQGDPTKLEALKAKAPKK